MKTDHSENSSRRAFLKLGLAASTGLTLGVQVRAVAKTLRAGPGIAGGNGTGMPIVASRAPVRGPSTTVASLAASAAFRSSGMYIMPGAPWARRFLLSALFRTLSQGPGCTRRLRPAGMGFGPAS